MSEVAIRPMRQGEREAVLDLLEQAFGFRELFVRYMTHDSSLRDEDTLLAVDGETPVACVQIFTKQIRLRGETLPAGGLGSVGTALAYRSRGLATRLLEHALAEMERRGMILCLLFSGHRGFYERHGFCSLAARRWLVPRPRPLPDLPAGVRVRDFSREDLGAVRALYDAYSADLDGSTARDAAYWTGQLRTAGNPEESFRVVERGSEMLGYARSITMQGREATIEFARRPEAARELAALLCSLAPVSEPLLVPAAPDPPLEETLRELSPRLQKWLDADLYWRVVQPERAAKLAGLAPDADQPDILRALIGEARALYWPSDRF